LQREAKRKPKRATDCVHEKGGKGKVMVVNLDKEGWSVTTED